MPRNKALKRKRRKRFNKQERIEIYNRTNGICYLCLAQVSFDSFHIDHVIPLYLGGTNNLSNLLPVHPVCNLVKGKKAL
jgi:5-methylcytosine-specific restriction endonuclease McrA